MTYEESLCMLSKDKWHTLNDDEKIEVFQIIEKKVAAENGRLSCQVEGKFLYTGNDGIVLGTYSPKEDKIYINTSQFDEFSKYGETPERLTKTLLHEGRHALQNQSVQGLTTYSNKEQIEEWRENLSDDNYISYKDNPRAYYNQPVEVDARKFAEERYQLLETERLKYINNENENCKMDEFRETFEEQMGDGQNIQNSSSLGKSLAADMEESLGMKV